MQWRFATIYWWLNKGAMTILVYVRAARIPITIAVGKARTYLENSKKDVLKMPKELSVRGCNASRLTVCLR